MAPQFRQLHRTFVGEGSNIDLSQDLKPNEIEAIQTKLDAFSVLVPGSSLQTCFGIRTIPFGTQTAVIHCSSPALSQAMAVRPNLPIRVLPMRFCQKI